MRRTKYFWAVVLGLLMAQLLPAQSRRNLKLPGSTVLPDSLPSANQQIANTIARNLHQSGHLKGYRIDISVNSGRAVLSGHVANEPQREEAIRIAQGVPGVERVLDQIQISKSPMLQRVQYPPVPRTLDRNLTADEPGEKIPLPKKITPPSGVPSVGGGAVMPEPTPIFRAPVPVASSLHPPRMPPYAWPTYAPYNNYSRVGYPTAYPYKSFPYIGPFYPFPKVPLGWRAVKLEWDDGYWWFSRTATKYGWWKIRFW